MILKEPCYVPFIPCLFPIYLRMVVGIPGPLGNTPVLPLRLQGPKWKVCTPNHKYHSQYRNPRYRYFGPFRYPLQVSLYSTLLYSLYCTVLYCTVLYCTVLYCTVLYCTVLYCTVLYCTVLYCTVLYCTLLYSTLLYSTIPYCTVLYYTILYYTMLY